MISALCLVAQGEIWYDLPGNLRGLHAACTVILDGCTHLVPTYTNYRGFVFHRYKVVLLLVQLRGPRSGRARPWRSGDCKSSFPDTFEPERIRTTQCEGVQLWQ